MSARRSELVRRLADGEFHSGKALAAALGVTRAAISKQARALRAWGLAVDSVPRRGHRLVQPLELYDADAIRAALSPDTRARLRRLAVHDEVDSTNARLLEVADLPAGRFDACLAEFQSAGRGRRGRRWIAPYGGALCLSYGWLFREPPRTLAALPLAAGVATRRALAACGIAGVALKWPNDLVRDDRKLGGILCELRAEAGGPAYVVIGIGLNVRLPAAAAATIAAAGRTPSGASEALPSASLADGACVPSRNRLAAALIDALTAVAVEFGSRGFAPFRAEWANADALAGRTVRVLGADGERVGVARGIADDGTLLVELDGRVEAVASGDVSLRAAP